MSDTTRPATILVVEDSPDDSTIFDFALRDARITNPVHHVEDGAEALDYIFGRGQYADRLVYPAPDLVFLDINLPKVGGLDVLAAIRERPELRSLPVVMLTVSDSDADVVRSYELDSLVYIRKPVTGDNLSSVCRAIPGLMFELRTRLP